MPTRDHAGEHAKCFVLTFSKTSTVTKFLCLRPADFFKRSSVSVNSTRVLGRSTVWPTWLSKKKKITGPQKKRKAALQVGSKSIELVTHRRLHSSFESRLVLVEHAAFHTPHLRDRRRSWGLLSYYSAFRQKFPKLWTSVAHSFLQQIAQNKNWAHPKATTLPRICKVEMQQASLLYYSAKPQSGGIWGCALVCPKSLYVRTIRFPMFCRVEACRA